MKEYSLFIEGLGGKHLEKRLAYGTLEELTAYLMEYFKRDLDPNDAEGTEIDPIGLNY